MNLRLNLFGISNVRDLTKAAVVSALYIVITMVFAALSFGPIQFRFSEGLNNLAVFNKRYVVAITLGCFISNMMSSLGRWIWWSELGNVYCAVDHQHRYPFHQIAANKVGRIRFDRNLYMFIVAAEIAYLGEAPPFGQPSGVLIRQLPLVICNHDDWCCIGLHHQCEV